MSAATTSSGVHPGPAAESVRIGVHVRDGRIHAVAVRPDGLVLAHHEAAVTEADLTASVALALDVLRDGPVDHVVIALPDIEPGTSGCPAGVLRIGTPTGSTVPPLTGWPPALSALVPVVATVAGGHEYDGRESTPLDVDAVVRFARRCRDTVGALAVTAVNGQEDPVHEARAAAVVTEVLGPEVPVLCGGDNGGPGLLERENTAALDALEAPAARRRIAALVDVVGGRFPDADLHLLRGDGTVLPARTAYRRTCALRGAAVAAPVVGALQVGRLAAAVVADLTGSVARVTVPVDRLVPDSGTFSTVRGVRTVLRAPRAATLRWDRSAAAADRLTAVVARCRPADAPVVAVGESAHELPEVRGRTVDRPARPAAAGALGAAVAEAAGSVDRTYWIGVGSRDAAVAAARRSARDAAVRAGADPGRLRESPVREGLLTYVPVPCVRLRVTAVGPLLDPTRPNP